MKILIRALLTYLIFSSNLSIADSNGVEPHEVLKKAFSTTGVTYKYEKESPCSNVLLQTKKKALKFTYDESMRWIVSQQGIGVRSNKKSLMVRGEEKSTSMAFISTDISPDHTEGIKTLLANLVSVCSGQEALSENRLAEILNEVSTKARPQDEAERDKSYEIAPNPIVAIQPRGLREAVGEDGSPGYVKVLFTISRSGEVLNPSLLDSNVNESYENEAIKAFVKWKYKPKVENGTVKVREDVVTTINFR